MGAAVEEDTLPNKKRLLQITRDGMMRSLLVLLRMVRRLLLLLMMLLLLLLMMLIMFSMMMKLTFHVPVAK